MPLPTEHDISTWKGAPWSTLMTLYDDDAGTQPHDFTGEDVFFRVWDLRGRTQYLELNRGNGITFGTGDGSFTVAYDTSQATFTRAKYELLWSRSDGTWPLLSGDFVLEWVA